MQPISIPYNFTPRDYQLEVFQAMDGEEGKPETRLKRVFLMWHRRAGKDMTSTAYMFKEMMVNPGIYYYFFPTFAQGRRVLWEQRDIMGMLYGFHDERSYGKNHSIIKRANKQEMLIELTNGSIFRIIGTDNIDSIVGTNPRGCIFSEYSLQDPKAWEYISPILAYNKGWAIFNGTPRGKNHFYKMLNNVKYSKNWHVSVMQTLYPDEANYTGLVPMEMIEMERESGKDEDVIHQEYGCSFSAASKGAYYNDLIERAREQKRIGDFPADDSKWTETAWDLGVDDSTAIWFFQRSGSKITLIDYYESHSQPIAHYVEVLQQKGYRYNVHHLPHDAGHRNIQTGKSTEDMFMECLKSAQLDGRTNIIPRGNVQAGIDTVRHLFSRFYFNEGTCTKGLELLSLYHKRYDEKKQTFLQQPVHDYTSHCADAFRMLAMSDEQHMEDNAHSIRVITNNNPYDY